MSLPCSDDEYLIAGITDQIMICKKRKVASDQYITAKTQNIRYYMVSTFTNSLLEHIIFKGKKLRSCFLFFFNIFSQESRCTSLPRGMVN
jgi:hypothetical protein